MTQKFVYLNKCSIFIKTNRNMKIKIIIEAMTDAGLNHWKNWTAKEISTWIKNHFSTNRYLSNKASLIIYSKINENE